jgi:hypothetical protein
LVTNRDVGEFMLGLPRKRGEWLQLTCGVEDTDPVRMGELVMERERVYTHNREINFYVLVADAISGFHYLKHMKERRTRYFISGIHLEWNFRG